MASSDDDAGRYEAVAALLAADAGLRLPSGSAGLLIDAVTARAARSAGGDVAAYTDRLLTDADPPELARLFEIVAVGQTALFRSEPAFQALRAHVLPALCADPSRRPVRLVSAGCSTGEEAWSLAACGVAVAAGRAPVEVIGIDWSASALADAHRAAYPAEAAAAVPPDLRRHFTTERVGGVRALRPTEALRACTRFERRNLVGAGDLGPPGTVDVVFFCNVSIYFERPVFRETVLRLHRLLRPGGVLFLGHAESLWSMSHPFTLADFGEVFAYRKPPADTRPCRVVEVVAPGWRVPERRGGAESAQPAAAAEALAAAQGMLVRGDVEEARAVLAELVASDPVISAAHYLLGCVHERTGDDAAALDAFGRALYLDPGFALAYVGRAGVHERRGDARRASAGFAAAARSLSNLSDTEAERFGSFLESMSVGALARMCEERARSAQQTVS